MSHLEADVRPGGAWRGCMRAIDTGIELWHGGVYREIVPDERIVFTFKWDSAALGPETLVTVLFEDRGGQTLMRFTQGVFNTAENCEGHRAGWESEFDQTLRLCRGARTDALTGKISRQYVARPPEMSNTAPVENEHSAEASQQTSAAISSTWPSRPIGIFDTM